MLGPPSRSSSPGSSIFDYPVGGRKQYDASEYTPHGASSPIKVSGLEARSSQSFVVISGGSGGNSIVGAFAEHEVTYVIPVSDNGGSSSEIIRVLGGPSIGDLRSRLIRLIPSSSLSASSSATEAIRSLLSYRFSLERSEKEARDEWRDIIEGRSRLWKGIPPDRKETIRGFLVYFETELLRHAHKNFHFRNGSVGNFCLAAMQLFLRSLPSAIFLLGSITGIQSNARILPVIVTNHTVTISAELTNSTNIIGQCEISHPVRRSESTPRTTRDERADYMEGDMVFDLSESTEPSNISFVKTREEEGHEDPLPSPINRLLYLNSYGQEIFPSPNPEFLDSLARKCVLIYACGSLWTSIIPCLALRGVATAIATSSSLEAKILLLNNRNDRETESYKASDYVQSIARSLNRSNLGGQSPTHLQPPRRRQTQSNYPLSAFVTHVFYLEGSNVVVDKEELLSLGVSCVAVRGKKFESGELAACLRSL